METFINVKGEPRVVNGINGLDFGSVKELESYCAEYGIELLSVVSIKDITETLNERPQLDGVWVRVSIWDEYEPMPCCEVSIDDLKERGYDTSKVTYDTLKGISEEMCEYLCIDSFSYALSDACDKFDIRLKE